MTVKSFRMPRIGTPQILAFLTILIADRLVSPQFFDIRLQDGRLFGSLVDVFNRGAPVALLSLGMVLVIATRGIDLSVGAVMAIAGAIAASLVDAHSVPVALGAALGVGLLCGLWNGFLVAVLRIQPIVATLILMVAGRGIAQLITEGRIVTFSSLSLAWFGNGSVVGIPAPVAITLGMLLLTLLLVRGTALGVLIEAVGAHARASAVFARRWPASFPPPTSLAPMPTIPVCGLSSMPSSPWWSAAPPCSAGVSA